MAATNTKPYYNYGLSALDFPSQQPSINIYIGFWAYSPTHGKDHAIRRPAVSLRPSARACRRGQSRGIAVRPVSPVGDTVSGKQWLMVIGINHYLSWPKLNTAVNDAKALKDVLLDRYYFDSDHLIELYDADATRRNILQKFRYLAKKVKPEDSLLVYYAGHGQIDPITKEGSWIPVESDTSNPAEWLSNHDIRNYLRADVIKARHILLVSDSCFSGGFFRGKRGKLPEVTDRMIKKAYRLASRQALTSGGLEPVSDAGFGDHSVFAYFMIQSLKNNNDPYLIPSAFFSDIRAGVSQNAEQLPTFGSLHDTGGQQGGEMVLFLKQEQRAKSLQAAEKKKWAELERLKQMEASVAKAKQQEDAEMAVRQKALAKLDAKIVAMKRRMGTSAALGDDSLENMVAMIDQKEAQEQKLRQLQRDRQAAERKRQAEIAALKAAQKRKEEDTFKADMANYQKIAHSKYGQELKDSAWKILESKYPELRPKELLFVTIPSGSFSMGSNDGDSDEKAVHTVHINSFRMSKYEITQSQWESVMGSNPRHFKGANRPVEQVSWDDIQTFIRKLISQTGKHFRLPTEAEWEYAARAGTTTRYSWGDDVGNNRANCDGCGSRWDNKETAPVGSFQPNSFGLYDMHGNVWEWVQDCYHDSYKGAPNDGSAWEKNTSIFSDDCVGRVLRGGSWGDGPGGMRSAGRDWGTPGDRYGSGGFRLVQD